MKKLLFGLMLATAMVGSAHAYDNNSDEQDYDCSPQGAGDTPELCKCSCVRGQCTPACIQPATPDIVVALRKRYPDLQDDDITVFDNGKHQYEVRFDTIKFHIACSLLLKPIRFRNCRPVHA
jgi:hypothetical protein